MEKESALVFNHDQDKKIIENEIVQEKEKSQKKENDDNDPDSEDSFYRNFKRRGPNDPIPEWALPFGDGLYEAMDKVPLFMSRPPSVEDVENNVTLSALQSLMYEDEDEDEDVVEEEGSGLNDQDQMKSHRRNLRAENYYIEGKQLLEKSNANLNEAMKQFDTALSKNPTDKNLLGNIYLEKSKISFKKGNYGTAISDAKLGIIKKPNESIIHVLYNVLIDSRISLNYFKEALDACKEILLLFPNEMFKKKKEFLMNKIKEVDRIEKAKAAGKLKMEKERFSLSYAIKKRGLINQWILEGNNSHNLNSISNSFLQMYIPFPLCGGNVPLPSYDDNDDRLYWPTIFLYPYYQQTDFVKCLDDQYSLLTYLENLFEESPSWDRENLYKLNEISNWKVFFPNSFTKGLPYVLNNELDLNISIKSLMALEHWHVINGILIFVVVPPIPNMDDRKPERGKDKVETRELKERRHKYLGPFHVSDRI